MRPDARLLLPLCLAIGTLGACSGDDDNVPDPPQTTGATGETGTDDTAIEYTGEPFQVRNHQGSVVLVRDAALKEGDPGYFRLYGVFGSDLRGVGTGQLCLDRGVCISELPTSPGDYVDLDGFFRTTEADFDWVGERVAIGNSPRDWMEMPFLYVVGYDEIDGVPVDEFGFYQGSASRLDRDEIPPLGVRIDEGEWGDNVEVDADDGIPLPILPRLVLPPAGVITPQAVVTFDWMWPPDPKPPEPPFDRGDTPLFLRLKSNELDRIYRMPQEGPFDLELGALGLNDSSQVEFYFGRWHGSEFRINANDLYVYGAIETRRETTACNTAAIPRVNLAGENTGSESPTIEVVSIGVSFDGLVIDDQILDYGWDAKGAGTPAGVSSALVFTGYDADQQPLCTVRYDASRATAIDPNSMQTKNAARLFGAWEIALANGITDCNRLGNVVFEGYPSLPLALQSMPWRFGLGEMGASSESLAQVYGNEWAEVEGQMYGLYVQRVLPDPHDRCPNADEVHVDVELGAVEAGAGFVYQQASCGVMNPDLVPLGYRPGSPMKGGIYSTSPVLPVDVVLPACPPPETTTAQ